MNIDLTGLLKIDQELVFDELTGNVTITFTDPENAGSPLGTLTIETSKLRAFIDSLETVVSEVPVQTFAAEFDHRTFYRVRDNKAETNFT